MLYISGIIFLEALIFILMKLCIGKYVILVHKILVNTHTKLWQKPEGSGHMVELRQINGENNVKAS